MKAYTSPDYSRCCPGHDPGSKKFDRACGQRRRNTESRRNAYRADKKAVRRENKKACVSDD